MSSNLEMALPNSDVDYLTINLNRKRPEEFHKDLRDLIKEYTERVLFYIFRGLEYGMH